MLKFTFLFFYCICVGVLYLIQRENHGRLLGSLFKILMLLISSTPYTFHPDLMFIYFFFPYLIIFFNDEISFHHCRVPKLPVGVGDWIPVFLCCHSLQPFSWQHILLSFFNLIYEVKWSIIKQVYCKLDLFLDQIWFSENNLVFLEGYPLKPS